MTRSKPIRRAYVIGAGLAGLAAAVRLTQEGVPVTVIEGAMQAGGRCRSYHDPVLDMTIDNGNHFVVSGNSSVNNYLQAIDATDKLQGLGDRGPAFHDLRDGSAWTLWPNDSALAWWVLSPDRRVLGTRAADYLAWAKLRGDIGHGEHPADDREEGQPQTDELEAQYAAFFIHLVDHVEG